MHSLRHETGSLSALFAFEAAGRLGSFTRAARELGVTQAAVSKQIAALEADLGLALFRRLHREVGLTDAGGDLFRIVTDALGSIGATMRSMRAAAYRRVVTVAATMTMSHFWLLPHLPSFRSLHAQVGIRILSQDEPLDLRGGAADIAIRFGDGSWRDGRVVPLFKGVIYAMASPAFLAGRGEVRSIDDVLGCPLIVYDTPDATWSSWGDWMRAAGQKGRLPAPELSFTRYMDALQAAATDQGIVLVWGGLTGGIEERGALVRLPGPVLEPPGDFYLVVSSGAEREPGCMLVSAWLTEEGERLRLRSLPPAGGKAAEAGT